MYKNKSKNHFSTVFVSGFMKKYQRKSYIMFPPRVIEKQKDRFGEIFLFLWLSEHTQGEGGCVWVFYHKLIYFTFKNWNVQCTCTAYGVYSVSDDVWG